MKARLYSGRTICVFWLLLFAVTFVSAGESVKPGVEQLYRLDQLAKMKNSVFVGSVSSYDRTGGNNDGFGGEYSFVRKEKDGLVLADFKGPGVIYRIWTPTPTDDVMEFYFDGETEPRITVKFRDLFLGKHHVFERPLVGYGAGGFYSYVPLPYEKSCKVFIRAEKVQFYQINYATYPESMGIKTFTANPDAEQQNHINKAKTLFASAGRDISSYIVPAAGKIEAKKTKVTLQSGKATTIFEVDSPGRIVGLRMSPADAFAGKKRDIILRAYWDGDPEPAVNCPAGDFFGYAWGEPATKSLLIGTNDGVNYCYFPMPFDKSARLELFAEGEHDNVTVDVEILFVPLGRDKDEGRFYSLWRRENPTTKGKPFTFIDTQGRGHLVGVVQQAQGMESGNTYYFEGDDQTTIDGQLVIHGTGSEDFYNGGWYDVPGRWETRRSFVLSGCLAYKKHLGRTGAYRIFLGDAYAYRESLLQTIEHAPTNNDLLNDYVGVTYLYSLHRPTCDFALPELPDRIVTDPQRIVFAAWWNVPIYSFSLKNATLTKVREDTPEQKDVRFLSMKAKNRDQFGPHSISFTCELPVKGTYKVSLEVVNGPEQAKVQLFQDEAPVGPVVDMYSEVRRPSPGNVVGTLELEQGANTLMFKLVGKNEKSTGLGFDLTNIICERIN